MSTFDYRVPAYHESAHAVGSYLLGLPIKSVYLTQGESKCDSGLTFGEIESRNLLRQSAIVAKLGPMFEEKFFGRADPDCCEEDENVIKNGLLPRIRDDSARAKLRAELARLAQGIMEKPHFREGVSALAEELLKQPGNRKEIPGPRAVEIIQAALNGS